MSKVNARDVAAHAGVSVSAVSRAFHPGSSISTERRQAVLAAARSLGYVHPVDQILFSRGSGTIALVAGNLSNPFYPMAVERLSGILHDQGRRMIFHAVQAGRDADSVLRQILDFRVDGAILTSTVLSTGLAAACRDNRMPVVQLNRSQTELGFASVCCDSYGGARMAAQHLLAAGRKRIAFMGGQPDASTHRERMRGFCDFLDEAGTTVHAREDGDFSYPRAFAAAQRLMELRPMPDAVFCANDIMAIATIDAAAARGVRVPFDLAVIGFDDIPMASWRPYNLTTVHQPLDRMITEALDLIERIAAEPSFRGDMRILPTRLIERGSA